MRYEFERDGTVVASVLWEGPGQVSVESADAATRGVVDRYLSSEVVYLGGGFDFGAEHEQDILQMRRRDWTPWEFERASLALAHRMGYEVERTANEDVERRSAPDAHANGHTNGRPAQPQMATAAFPGETQPATNGHRAAEPAPEASA